jgi:hypothetical protein
MVGRMSVDFVLLSPQKPREGQPCNGCGYCCQNETCLIGRMITGSTAEGPCALLDWDGSRYLCGALQITRRIGTAESHYLRLRMGIGIGCDSEMGSA